MDKDITSSSLKVSNLSATEIIAVLTVNKLVTLSEATVTLARKLHAAKVKRALDNSSLNTIN